MSQEDATIRAALGLSNKTRTGHKRTIAVLLLACVLAGVVAIAASPASVLGQPVQGQFDATFGAMSIHVVGTNVGWAAMRLVGYASWDGHNFVITLQQGSYVRDIHMNDWTVNGTYFVVGTITVDSTNPLHLTNALNFTAH